jgi:tetratricopeptide (TPR) repeat protein
MKRTISLWLALVAFSLLPALAQTPAPAPTPMGKIHGHVINPTGVPATTGTVSLSTDNGRSYKYTFPLSSNGEYSGEAAPGTYVVLYRQPETPANQMVDFLENVKVVAGQDVSADLDMSRKEFIDKLAPEQRKALEDIKKHNAEAMKVNEVIKAINADLKVVAQDIKDADGARATATQALGATASKTDIDAKAAEITAAKFGEAETLMLKDTAAKPDASVLWANLGQAQVGLKKYDDAEVSFKKVLELEAASKKPNVQSQGAANAGLGEIYARTGKVPEATAAYDAAAKVNPAQAAMYLKNEAVIFYNQGNAAAQMAAADEAIAADPTQPMPYYLKGQGLIQSATFDAKTHKIVLPPGCADAYQKYLELAPTGPYAGEVKGILDQAGQTVSTTFKATKPAKK